MDNFRSMDAPMGSDKDTLVKYSSSDHTHRDALSWEKSNATTLSVNSLDFPVDRFSTYSKLEE